MSKSFPLFLQLRGQSLRQPCALLRARFSSIPKRSHAEDQSNFLGSFIEQHKPPQSAVDHFSARDWARKILQDDRYEIVPFFPRHFNERTGENRFFARTVNTETTIPHVLSLRLKDLPSPDTPSSAGDPPGSVELRTRPDVLCLMSLGRDLEEHPSIVHGGFQAVLFDEIMRFVILLYHDRDCKPGPRSKHYTVNMSLSYRAPLLAQSNVFLRSRLVRRDGRKWFTEAEIVDSTGKILTIAESTWVTKQTSIA